MHLLFQAVEGQLHDIDHGSVLGGPVRQKVYERPSVAGPLLCSGPLAMFPRLHKNPTSYLNSTGNKQIRIFESGLQ